MRPLPHPGRLVRTLRWLRRAVAAALVFVLAGVVASRAHAQAPAARFDALVTRSGAPVSAAVTLTGATLPLSAQTDDNGALSVPIEPGTYAISVQPTGEAPVSVPGFRVAPGERHRLTIDLAQPATARVVRVDPARRDDLDARWFARLPLDRRDPLTAAALLFPGIAPGATLGAGTGRIRRVDGMDLSDPIDGSALASHTVTAAQTVAVAQTGLSAAEPGFAGAVLDVIARSGGNGFSGLFDARATGDGLRGENTPEDLLEAHASLADRTRLMADTDVSGTVGGPLRRDRAFFSGSFGYTRAKDDPEGPRTALDTTTPRAQGRVVITPSAANTLTAAFFFEDRQTSGAAFPDVARVATDEVSNRVGATTTAARVLWQRAMGRASTLRAYWSFLDGSRNTEPETRTPGRLDETTGAYTGSLGIVDGSSRQRHVVGASFATTLHAAGAHGLEAGVEFDSTRLEQTSGFVDDRFYVDFGGRPNLELDWAGADREGRSRRLSGFVRDTWAPVARLTIDAGVRVDALRGSSPDAGAVYTPTVVQPRAGASFALDGQGRTVIRASYAQYAEPLWFSHYDRAVPGVAPLISYEVAPGGGRREVERLTTPVYGVDGGLRQPYVTESAIGVTQQLGALTFSVSGVFRDARNLVDAVYPDARWIAVTRPGLPGSNVTIYRWANRAASEANALITNVDGVEYRSPAGASIGAAAAERRYRGLLASGRYESPGDRVSLWGAWTYAQIQGTVDDRFDASISRSTRFQSPSASLVNVDGEGTQTPAHVLTLLATTRIPWIGSRVSAIYVGRTGRRYAALRQFGNETLDFPQADEGRQVLLEPRGARTLASEHTVDLRGEHTLRVGARQRLTLYADVINLLNRADILEVSSFYPFVSAGGAAIVRFEDPTVLRAPRQIYFGGRWAF